MKFRKGQVATEFIILVVVGIFIVLVFIIIASTLSDGVLEDHDSAEIEDLALSLQQEIILASLVQDGYHRPLHIPVRLSRGTPYTITSTKDSFTIIAPAATLTMDIPNINGTLELGENLLVRENGTIYIIT